jgi:xylan 1,4-beta-xylosidase
LIEEVEVLWADAHPIAARSLVDDFDGPTVHPELVSVRTAPGVRRAELGERPGHLRLHAASGGLHERAAHAFAGFRLEQPVATLATVLEIPDAPSPGLLAGLALRLSERRYVTFGVRAGTAGRILELVLHLDGEDRVLGVAEVPPGRLGLVLEIDGFEAVALFEHGERRIAVGTADLSPLSPSEGGGFVGVVGGVFVVGEPAGDDQGGSSSAWADFDLLSLVHPPTR